MTAARARNRGNSRRRRQSSSPELGRGDSPAFWGDPEALPLTQPDVRIADDPAAVVRSLGPPPLPGHESIAEHYFAAVYDRAVTLAGALAAAGGLVQPEELPEDGSAP